MIPASLRADPTAAALEFARVLTPPAEAPADLSRRSFLKITGAATGLVVAFHFSGRPARAAAAEAALGAAPGSFAPNAFLRIAPDGAVTVFINHAEMGQGVTTALSMLVAEELDADWSRVSTEFAQVGDAYKHTAFGLQMTGGSSSTWSEYERLRKAGATARALLVEAAAQQWSVPASECTTAAGFVVHRDGRKLGYGELVDRAAKLPVPADVPLKPASSFRLIGKATPRIDSRSKVNGTAEFGLDVQRPGLLVAVVVRPPTFGGQVDSFDAKAALATPGVKSVVRVPSGVAVIARDYWTARQAGNALAGSIKWKAASPKAVIDTEKQAADFAALSRTPGKVAAENGDAPAALKAASKTVEADYTFPYLAHAPMEPLNATVEFTDDRAEIWTGTQFPSVDQMAAAKALGLKPEQVKLNTTFLGGGFGRRATPASDWVTEAAHVAKAAREAGINAPIKTVWSREDDLAGGFFRPMFHHRLSGGIDAQGKIVAWQQTVVGQSFLVGTPFAAMIKNGIDETSVEGASDSPYRVPARRVELHSPLLPVPTLWWRSVGHTHTAVAVECFIDELAHLAGRSPLDVRRELLPPDSRELRVLNLAVEKSGYGKTKLPAGHAHGLAVHQSFGSYVAQVAEVSLENGRPKVHRITAVVDCGTVVNPLTVEAQLQGSIMYALTALYYGEITLQGGVVQEKNFHQYQISRMNETPAVDVHIIATGDKMGGIGETGVPPTFAAVLNGIFAATGNRVRSLPLKHTSFT